MLVENAADVAVAMSNVSQESDIVAIGLFKITDPLLQGTPDYITFAKSFEPTASYFDLGVRYNQLTAGKAATLNRYFIQNMVDAGKTFKINVPFKSVPVDSSTYDEVHYLLSRGYRLLADDITLVPR